MSYPILYPSTETDFDTNGLGVLSDAVSCTVTEERNGAYECELDYPEEGIHREELRQRAILLVQPGPGRKAQPFRIYRVTTPMSGEIRVYAEHLCYDLAGIPVETFTANSALEAFTGLAEHAVVPCPFRFETDVDTSAEMTMTSPSSAWELLGGKEGSILDCFGGEYEFDFSTVRLLKARGADRGASIRYGKNLVDLEQEENCADLYIGVYPYWAKEGQTPVTLDKKVVYAPGGFDYRKIQILDLSGDFEEAPGQEQLREAAEAYIRDNGVGVPSVSIEANFVQLEQYEEYETLAALERVELCDTVEVYFPRLSISAAAEVVKTEYDALLERYKKVTLGSIRQTIADTIAGQGKALSRTATIGQATQIASAATRRIRLGGAGGGTLTVADQAGETIGTVDRDGFSMDRMRFAGEKVQWKTLADGTEVLAKNKE